MRESKVSTGFSSGDYKVHRNGGPKRNEKHGGNSRVEKMAQTPPEFWAKIM